MNEEEARRILGESIREDGTINNLGHYMNWYPGKGGGESDIITLDSDFTVEELEAIVWWMRNMRKEPQ